MNGTETGKDTRIRRTGYGVFFLSGICAMSSGVVVSLLREQYGLSFAQTGTLLSMMSIGNMLAAFLAGTEQVHSDGGDAYGEPDPIHADSPFLLCLRCAAVPFPDHGPERSE